jgi:hypothetical protein
MTLINQFLCSNNNWKWNSCYDDIIRCRLHKIRILKKLIELICLGDCWLTANIRCPVFPRCGYLHGGFVRPLTITLRYSNHGHQPAFFFFHVVNGAPYLACSFWWENSRFFSILTNNTALSFLNFALISWTAVYSSNRQLWTGSGIPYDTRHWVAIHFA